MPGAGPAGGQQRGGFHPHLDNRPNRVIERPPIPYLQQHAARIVGQAEAMLNEASERRPKGAKKMGRPTASDAIRLTGHILKSAREVFFERGFDGASSDMIADRARISKRTLYARFGSKARVFEAVILDEIDTQLRALEPTIDDRLDVAARLKAIADVLLEWLLTTRIASMERVVIAQAVRFPALAANIHDFGYQRAVQWVASILAHANAKGELALADPVFAAEQFVTLVVVAPMRRSALGLAPAAYDSAAQERVRRGIDLFLGGCRPAPVKLA
jgi:TetR/AcrR family transcriptional regulator, mexJK operon transcriptional repressor